MALDSADWPLVIKADGLCAGKGVLVTSSAEEAGAFITRVMERREFGDAGRARAARRRRSLARSFRTLF